MGLVGSRGQSHLLRELSALQERRGTRKLPLLLPAAGLGSERSLPQFLCSGASVRGLRDPRPLEDPLGPLLVLHGHGFLAASF